MSLAQQRHCAVKDVGYLAVHTASAFVGNVGAITVEPVSGCPFPLVNSQWVLSDKWRDNFPTYGQWRNVLPSHALTQCFAEGKVGSSVSVGSKDQQVRGVTAASSSSSSIATPFSSSSSSSSSGSKEVELLAMLIKQQTMMFESVMSGKFASSAAGGVSSTIIPVAAPQLSTTSTVLAPVEQCHKMNGLRKLNGEVFSFDPSQAVRSHSLSYAPGEWQLAQSATSNVSFLSGQWVRPVRVTSKDLIQCEAVEGGGAAVAFNVKMFQFPETPEEVFGEERGILKSPEEVY